MGIIKGKVRIGTSNGYMPGTKLSFPPEYRQTSRLHYYSTLLNTIEVNSSFYKVPLRSTYEKWGQDVPEDFQFSLKLSKEITHDKQLARDLSIMEEFLHAASGIGEKKGCLLIQFPGKVSLEQFSQVEQILAQLRMQDPDNEWRTAVEFRNESWYITETTELLDEYGAAMVLHDFAKAKVSEPTGNAGFVYQRFHGPAGNYRGSYSDQFLGEKAEAIRSFIDAGKDVYVYFNNTMGSAFENARWLQSKLLSV